MANCEVVSSPRSASIATLALNSAEYRFRLPIIGSALRRRTKLNHLSEEWRPPQYHPWTNGQAERMNRTVKEATIKAFHYPDLDSLKAHVLAFVSAHNFAKHVKAL